MKYRKKSKESVVIEAWQWNFSKDQEEVPTWLNEAFSKFLSSTLFRLMPEPNTAELCLGFTDCSQCEGARISIITRECAQVALPGYWIVKDANGELSVYQPNIFKDTYEVV